MQREAVLSTARMMAWRTHCYGPLAELRLEEARVPPLRAPDQVLVRVRTTSINPLDIAMVGGYGARMLNVARSLGGVGGSGGAEVEFPLVVGRDVCGEVVRAGAGSRLRGRVWGVLPPHWPGAHAQYVVLRDRWASEAPACLSDAEAGGALYAALSACAALRVAGLPPRPPPARPAPPAPPAPPARAPRVLLLGLGGVGHAALQLLVYSGAQVIVGCSGDLCPRAMSLGASAAFDRHAADYDRLLEESGPYEVILDCAGLGGAEAGARRWRFARYVTLSAPLLRAADTSGPLAGAARALATLAQHTAAAHAAGAVTAGSVAPVRWAFFSPCAQDLQLLRKLADAGKFKVEVERVFPWWAGAEAYEHAATHSARGKLLLDFTATPAPLASPTPPATPQPPTASSPADTERT